MKDKNGLDWFPIGDGCVIVVSQGYRYQEILG